MGVCKTQKKNILISLVYGMFGDGLSSVMFYYKHLNWNPMLHKGIGFLTFGYNFF
jgi:hypothetical protein